MTAFSRQLCLLFLCLASAAAQSVAPVVAWVKQNAIPLQTVQAAHGFDDMKPLARVVGDARIVALGEATHGTREIFQLKHRIVEYLATQKGFTIFSIEANMPEAYRLNDFVLNGRGDPRQLIRGMYFWTWQTEEMLDMVIWMREFNRSGKGRIEFTGFDMQTPTVAAEIVRAFVTQNDPAYAVTLKKLYADLPGLGAPPQAPPVVASVAESSKKVLAHLQSSRAAYKQAGRSDKEIEWAIQNARVVLQSAEMNTGERSRDQSMADNIKWIADQNLGARIVLWAHNGHISKSRNTTRGYLPMGVDLEKMFGKSYVNFGFAFNQGAFRAWDLDARTLHEFTLPAAPADAVDAVLAAAAIPVFALDLRKAPSEGAVAKWLNREHRARSIGSSYSTPNGRQFFLETKLPETYDVILFLNETTAAHAMK